MILVPALTALCDSLATQTGAQVSLGRPEQEAGGTIYVWPWKLEEQTVARNAVPRAGLLDKTASGADAMIVHVLVLMRPAATPEGLALLEMARQAVLDQPIVDVAGRRTQIRLESLSHVDLTGLFNAAGLPLSVCLAATVQMVE